tara:strand:- start:9 stop:1049 length:1041 start_codon:yes stop_codon:yes gene_type:complete
MRELLTDKETAKILHKTTTSLYKTVDFFDSRDDDEWDLKEGEHFEFVKGGDFAYRPRRFTEEGVEALARYYEEKGKVSIIDSVLDALFQRRIRRKRMLVSRRITQEFIEAVPPPEIKGELAFVQRKTTINILQTNGKGLNNSEERLFQAGSLDGQEGLEIDKHFALSEDGQKTWSQKGIASIAIDMSRNSRISKARKAWMDAVGDVVEDCFSTEVKRISAAPLRIEKVISAAKKSAGQRCQVSGKRKTRTSQIQLHGHHLFDQATRPDLADLHENILVVEGNIHSEFHSWKKKESCEPKDFLNFLSDVRLDLVDPENKAAARRYNKLVARLTKLQKNYEGNHLKYK